MPSRKYKIVIEASMQARSSPTSRFLRLIRDYADTLKLFEIHATRGTGQIMLGSGLYDRKEIKLHRPGPNGGVAELAAIVASGECSAAILLLDPSDAWSDAVENRALRRVCNEKEVRLISTFASAVHWADFRGRERVRPADWKPSNWKRGINNVTKSGYFRQLAVEERTIALISHDRKKLDMFRFVNDHSDTLSRHHRIITTGTTGWLLKLLFADQRQLPVYLAEAKKKVGWERFEDVFNRMRKEEADKKKRSNGQKRAGNKAINFSSQWKDLKTFLKELRSGLGLKANGEFTKRVVPLPSGPMGGDVLIANEALGNKCHTIVFFHDPQTSHPHNDDIRLLERTCQLKGVFTDCISNKESAEKWIEGLDKELSGRVLPRNLAQELRQKYNLKEVIIVPSQNDVDSFPLGTALARGCAGYLNREIHRMAVQNLGGRIALSWSWTMRQVLKELKAMRKTGLIDKPERLSKTFIWSPLIGTITSEVNDQQASMVAQSFCDFYGGTAESFGTAAFTKDMAHLPKHERDLIQSLGKAKIIIALAAPWKKAIALRKSAGLDVSNFPRAGQSAGAIGGIFLKANGDEASSKLLIVGLGYEGLRAAARDGSVILICGGRGRRPILLAALRGKLVSILITSRKTADWILRKDRPTYPQA